MKSIRAKITGLMTCAIVAAMLLSTLISVAAMKELGDSNSTQMLSLLCETGEKNLDARFQSVEQSVELVAGFVEADLKATAPDGLERHIRLVREVFARAARQTNGILTYYYRIDPAVSRTEKGFWYIRQEDGTFQEREVTDITLYDKSDTTSLRWFTVPRAKGEPVWLPPYITENLDVRVISYNIPIYWKDEFFGVIGIEMDYSIMAEQVDNIRLYEDGYAFVCDGEGRLICHPFIDVASLTDETQPKVPDALSGESSDFRYTYNGVDKQAVCLPLENGMRLFVSVPVSEINSGWKHVIFISFLVSILLVVVFALLTLEFAARITAPLRDLTEAAEQVNRGSYDFEVEYAGEDEVGILAQAFRKLVSYLKTYISDLNDRAYADALTSVRNKGAFDIYLREMEERMEKEEMQFAVIVFDCDGLKQVNDHHGHDKGDIYLKTASALICRVFKHSPVFRTGGDEFTVILRGEDFQDREELVRKFARLSEEACSAAAEPWEEIRASMGLAVFDAQEDQSVGDTIRRADKLMYEEKRRRKAGR